MAGMSRRHAGEHFDGPRDGWGQVRGTGEPMGGRPVLDDGMARGRFIDGPDLHQGARPGRGHGPDALSGYGGRGGPVGYDQGWQSAGFDGTQRGYDAGLRRDGPGGGRMRGPAGFGRDVRAPVRRGAGPDFWGDSMRGAGRGYDSSMRIAPRGFHGAGRGYDAGMRRSAGYDRGVRGGMAQPLSDAEFYRRVDRW